MPDGGLWPRRDSLPESDAVPRESRILTDTRRATFQRAEVQRARATVDGRITPGAVVITTEDVGRPAENIEYYAGVSAFYLTDLERWRVPVPVAAEQLLAYGIPTYLLLPPAEANPIVAAVTSRGLGVKQVADVAPAEAIDYFVAAPLHPGVRLALFRIGRD